MHRFVLPLLCVIPIGEAEPGTQEAPTEPVWVFFTDKRIADLDAALAKVAASYDRRAIERRRLRRTAPGLFDERDVPLAPGYVAAVARIATLRTRCSWVNAVSVDATPTQRRALRALPFVRDVQPVARLAAETVPPNSTARPPARGFYGAAEGQLTLMNLPALHKAGFTGKGVVVGVLDTGFQRTHKAFNTTGRPLKVVAEWDFVNNDPVTAPQSKDPANQHHHGTLILGSIGAYQPNVLVGGAYDASFILAKVEDIRSEYKGEEDWFARGLQFIEQKGGDVATSSLVIRGVYTRAQLNGKTSVMAKAFNTATQNGVHCFQGAGNANHDANPATTHLEHPADAFDVVTVGAVASNGRIASFSSDGPTTDGRVKPEVLAQGVSVATTSATSTTAVARASGTSLATPLVASVAACLVQAHPKWTVAQMRAALSMTAKRFVATGTHDPLFVQGYGIVDALAASRTTGFLLDARPKDPAANQTLSFRASGGRAKGPFALAVAGVNGIPTILWLHRGLLDDRGDFRFSLRVPPGLKGFRIDVAAVADVAPGRWELSNFDSVTFR